MSVYIKKLLGILANKFYMKFALKISLSSYAIYQSAREDHLNIRDNYIQALLKKSK